MAPWTSYRLLESAERADGQDEAELSASPPISKSQRQLAQILQPFSALGRRIDDALPAGSFVRRQWRTGVAITSISAAILILLSLFGSHLTQQPSQGHGSQTHDASGGDYDVLHYVDPLIGTGRGGHVFAGATLPFSMAKAVADVDGEKQGGFASDNSSVTGFSHMHDSGTGGSPSLGNFPLFLHPRCASDSIESCHFNKDARKTPYKPESVYASPGYFSIELTSGLKAEMTVSERAALYKFSFPGVNGSNVHPVMVSDADCLPGSPGPRTMNVDAKTGRMTGSGNYEPSFGLGKYDAYFCADFKGATVRSTGGFNSSVFPGATQMTGYYRRDPSHGVYVEFQEASRDTEIMARVGVSWLSIERACQNAETQIPDWDFDSLRSKAADAWREKLSPITISAKGVDGSHLRNYWSGVYRAFISPQDYTGENPLWDSDEPYYDSWYCIWDTFRGVHPFFTLVDPISQARMVRSLIDIYKHEGWMPDCRMSFCKGYTQGGSNADVILVDGFVKKLPGVDWDAAYEALIKDAEVQPQDWRVVGRGGLASWKAVGYIPLADSDYGGYRTRSISRTVEYAYNDFCIAEIANATGRYEDYEKYAGRASNWKNLYKEDYESMGYSGFLQPRLRDGQWGEQAADLCSALNNFDGCYLGAGGHETYEGSPWLYTFYVPGDMAGLIKTMGGRESFLKRLDTLHDSGVLYMGDEQAFMTAFLYHYVGRPGLSAKRTHAYIPSMFNDTIAGIPGNDDSGAMGTFVFFSMLGIFPNAGQSVYFIIPPFFEEVKVKNPQTGKTVTIRNVNFDAAYENIYIQSATLNGQPYTKNWVDHSLFMNGGVLELVLGKTESDWGTREEDCPPSLSTGLYLP